MTQGRRTHREIDARLPTAQEKLTLRHVVDDAKLELVKDGNTTFDQDGNWRLRIDASGNLLLQVRSSGTWTTQATFTP